MSINIELKGFQQKKLHRLISKEWIDREKLAEEMFMSEEQVTKLVHELRVKCVNINTRPHKTKRKHLEYKLGEDLDRYEPQTLRSEKALNELMIMEMNRIRLESENLNVPTITYMAVRALEASGIRTESLKANEH